MTELLFELKNVSFSYLGKFPALCCMSCEIRRGSRIAVIGANGSGKSTLLHLLDGLIFPDEGRVTAFGKELHERLFCDEVFSRDFRKRVGLVFQNPDVQLFCPTTREDIVFGPLQLGIAKSEIKKRLEELTSDLGIQGLLERSPHQLSIGEKRKVALASTLILDPEVLLLDEPTAGLDPLTTRHIMDMLAAAHARGKTIITSTHDLHIVEEIADTIFVLSQDKALAKSGPSEDILSDEALLKDHNLVHIHSHHHEGKVHTHPHLHAEHRHGD